MKGLFIPEITAEMFRNGCLESIEALMAEGEIYDIEYDLKSAQSERPEQPESAREYCAETEQRWIPVTLETLPNPNSVVVICGKKGTWDYGTYRGWYGDIHSWQWKKNTIKHVYWWMYKTDALPEPYRKEN